MRQRPHLAGVEPCQQRHRSLLALGEGIDDLARQDAAVYGTDRHKAGGKRAVHQLLCRHRPQRRDVRRLQSIGEIDAELLVRRRALLGLLQLRR